MEAITEFEKKMRETTWEDFALLIHYNVETGEYIESPEMLLAVKKVQDIMIEAIKKFWKNSTKLIACSV